MRSLRTREVHLELIDFLRIIWHQRYVIIAGILACTGLGFGAGVLLPDVYQTSFDLRSGIVSGTPTENPYRIAETINSEPFLEVLREQAGLAKSASELRRDHDVSATPVSGKQTPAGQEAVLVRVVTQANTPESSLHLARTVADLVVQSYRERFDVLVEKHSRYQKDLEKQLQTIGAEIDELDRVIKSHRASPEVDAPAVILLQAQLEQKQAQLLEFRRELRNVEINASSPFTENTRVVYPPVLPDAPVNLRPPYTALIGAVVGLVPVLLLAFLIESIRRAGERGASEGAPGQGRQPDQ